MVTLLAWPAVAPSRVTTVILRARLLHGKSRCVNGGRLPAHRPYLEFSVGKREEHNNDQPSHVPR